MTKSWPQIAASMTALAVAFGGGVIVGRSGGHAQPVDMVTTPAQAVEGACLPNGEDLRLACIPFMRDGTASLQAAEVKVESLSMRVQEKETEVHHLEKQIATKVSTAGDLSARLEQARAELLGLQLQLQEALAAKKEVEGRLGQAETQLAQTRSELKTAREQTDEALDEAASQRWTAFVNDAQLTLCREGNRERLTACRESVAGSLARWERDYKVCVRSEQATPELKQARSGEELPQFGKYLDPDNTVTSGWYVLFCDPNLPEAAGGGGGGRMRQVVEPRYFRERAQKALEATAQETPDTQTTAP